MANNRDRLFFRNANERKEIPAYVKEVVLSESGVSRKRKKTSRLVGVTSLECRT